MTETYIDGVRIPLENYKHILDRIVLTWGTQECINYMTSLIQNTDRKPRSTEVGFLPGTKDTILELIKQHPTINEIRVPKKGVFRWLDTDHGVL